MNPAPMEETPTARRLERVFHEVLDREPVDVAGLVRSTRRAARRARTARRVRLTLVCAASVAAAGAIVPVAVAHLQARARSLPPVDGRPALTPAPVRSGTPSPGVSRPPSATRSPTPSTVPEVTDAAALGDAQVAYAIPDAVAFRQADFPRPLPVLGFDSHQDRLQPPAPDQSCRSPRARPDLAPIAGRTWEWYERRSDRPQLGVILTVTGYPAGTAHARFRDTVTGRGECTWSITQRRAVVGDLGGDEAWAATEVRSVAQSLYYGRVVVRVGDAIVGVEVGDPDGTTASLRLAERLATTAAHRVAARIPQAHA